MSKENDQSMQQESVVPKQVEEPGFWQELWQQVRLVYYLILDPEVPIYLKLLPFVAVVYLLIPFDFMPDFMPALGQIDDLTLLLIGAKVFIELSPPHVVQRHMQRMREKFDSFAAAEEKTLDPEVVEGIIIEPDKAKTEDEEGTVDA